MKCWDSYGRFWGVGSSSFQNEVNSFRSGVATAKTSATNRWYHSYSYIAMVVVTIAIVVRMFTVLATVICTQYP